MRKSQEGTPKKVCLSLHTLAHRSPQQKKKKKADADEFANLLEMDDKFDGATVTSYLGGIRVRGNLNDKIAPFGQFLVGAEHCCGSTETTFQPGVGIDFAINPTLNFRAQVDFRTVRYAEDDLNSQRYTFGISIPLPAGR